MSILSPSHDDPDLSSDSDLELNELDPQTSSRPALPRRQPSNSSLQDFARIPLRNLRFGRRRQPREEDAEDLEALVGDGDDTRKRGYGDDDAPLLPNGHGGSRQQHRPEIYPIESSRLRRRRGSRGDGWRRYVPFISRSTSIALPSSAPEDEPEDEHDPGTSRTISVGAKTQLARFPPNAVSNAKYTPYSFLPRTLWNEFKFFFNMYFLLVALSQIVPALRIGYLSTYVAPLAFVICVTLGKEAYDDIYRRKRDGEANSETYKVLQFDEPGAGLQSSDTGRKRKIKTLSERKRGKRRRTEEDESALAEPADQHEGVEASERPSASVREVSKASKDLKVGDVVVLAKDQRIPADVIVLKSFSAETIAERRGDQDHDQGEGSSSDTTLVDMGVSAVASDLKLKQEAAAGAELDNQTTSSDPSGGGEAFIRTDQLDGETDWKLRLASPLAQTLSASEYVRLRLTAGKPDRRVNDFVGTLELLPKQNSSGSYDPHISREQNSENTASAGPDPKLIPLTIDNTAWANTVLASSTTVHAVVTYTGLQTRAALSTSPSRSKTGLLEYEINSLTKILCILTAALSLILVALEGFNTNTGHTWYVAVLRFLILFSTIVPISLRVNLDMGKSVYAWFIHRDTGIPGTVVRTSTIPEDLGRIEYLLSDKTGTLTRNEMELRKVHVGTVSYGGEAMEEVSGYIKQAFALTPDEAKGGEGGMLFTPSGSGFSGLSGTTRTRREIGVRVRDLVLALAVCHNVTPTSEEDDTGKPIITYQASSPDEIAIVQWTEHVGLRLVHRDRKSISLQFIADERMAVKVEILNVFPFTSDSKRMGIIVRFLRHTGSSKDEEGEIVFFQKGADTVMSFHRCRKRLAGRRDWQHGSRRSKNARYRSQKLESAAICQLRISILGGEFQSARAGAGDGEGREAAFGARCRTARRNRRGRQAAECGQTVTGVTAECRYKDLDAYG